jgi:hypothetical protein
MERSGISGEVVQFPEKSHSLYRTFVAESEGILSVSSPRLVGTGGQALTLRMTDAVGRELPKA